MLVTIGGLGAYTLIALIGNAQDAREERILGVFSALFLWIRDQGAESNRWLVEHRINVGIGASLALALIALAALWQRGRAALPVGLLALSLSLAGWAQIVIQGPTPELGLWLFLAAAAGAVGLGIWVPLASLAAVPPFPPPSDPAARAAADSRRLAWGWECALVFALVIAGLLSRTWALTELYDFLDLETVDWMVSGRTWQGFKSHLDFGFVQNNGGAIQLLPTQIVFRLFGTSIFTLRMTSVLWGVAGVPLMYWLGRRLAGVTAGVIAAVFFITAPEQLFWARNENAYFAPIAICALVTAHMTVWLVQRFSPWALLWTALWMPWCRWFYSASMVAFLIPIAASLHALIFARGLWRKVWYVIPGLALGVVFWIFSLSVMKTALHNGEWHFVHPAAIYGASAWRKQGEFATATPLQLVGLQAVSMSQNLAEVARNMSYHTPNFSHWCQRAQGAERRTIMNVGLALLVWLALGYLVGQVYDRRAFLLVAWWGIAVLPAILSQEPADRRMAMMFPASHALAGTFVAAVLYMVRERGGRVADLLARGVAALGLAVIAVTNLSSYLGLPINPMMYGDYPRVTRPLFEESDAIFTNVPGPFRSLSLLGNLDHFLVDPICVQAVEADDWLAAALQPQCRFDDVIYAQTLPDAAVDELRRTYHPQRISYLLVDDPVHQPAIDLLRALHPHAPTTSHTSPRTEHKLVQMTVDAQEIADLRRPTLRAAAGAAVPEDILAGVALRREAAPEIGGGLAIDGGVLIAREGWYRWSLAPPCRGASLSIDGRPVLGDDRARPLLRGAHPFVLTIPDPAACQLPLRLVAASASDPTPQPLPAERFIASAIAARDEVRADAAETYGGFAAPQPAVQLRGARPIDFGVDGQGNIAMLVLENSEWSVRRFAPDGTPLNQWPIAVPPTLNLNSLAVAADGTVAVPVQRTVHLFDPKGREFAAWEHPWLVWESELAFWGPDLLIANIHHRDALAVFNRQGELVKEFLTFDGGPGRFYQPTTVSISERGEMLVGQLDRKALRFRLSGDTFEPQFLSSFGVDGITMGAAADGDRILAATEADLRAYRPDGRRLMADEPGRDLSNLPLRRFIRVQRAGDILYALDPDRGTLWRLTE
ncbi:MAG: hypothetical protein ACRERC_19600 [Candidatus Binatia bacterium]